MKVCALISRIRRKKRVKKKIEKKICRHYMRDVRKCAATASVVRFRSHQCETKSVWTNELVCAAHMRAHDHSTVNTGLNEYFTGRSAVSPPHNIDWQSYKEKKQLLLKRIAQSECYYFHFAACVYCLQMFALLPRLPICNWMPNSSFAALHRFFFFSINDENSWIS